MRDDLVDTKRLAEVSERVKTGTATPADARWLLDELGSVREQMVECQKTLDDYAE